MMRKKLYLVKREVIATSIERAVYSKGVVYEVVCTEEKNWPEEKKKLAGFKKLK